MIEQTKYSEIEKLVENTFIDRCNFPNYVFREKYENYNYLYRLMGNGNIRNNILKGFCKLLQFTNEDFYFLSSMIYLEDDKNNPCFKIYKNATEAEIASTMEVVNSLGRKIYEPPCKNIIMSSNPNSWAALFEYHDVGVLAFNSIDKSEVNNIFSNPKVQFNSLDDYIGTGPPYNDGIQKYNEEFRRNYPA